MILFNENVIHYLELVRELGGSQKQAAIPARLLLVYFGLCFVAFGAVVYNIFCPSEVKRYDSAEAYVGDAAHNVPMIVRANYERALINSSSKEELEAIKRKSYVPEEYWKAFLHIYFENLNHKHPAARAYAVGLLCLSVPSAQVFLRVVVVAFGMASRMS